MPSCGEALVALLQRAGVTTVFGIPGVHTLELYRGIGASGLRHVAPRHEQGAAFMADGYARVTGRPGVCVLIGGPGLTNAITPIAQAYHDSIPMLVVSGAVPASERDLGEIHDLPDQQALLETVTAFSHTVADPGELGEVMDRALEVFSSRRPRPVHIALPLDVIKQPADDRRVEATGAGAAGRRSGGRRPRCVAADRRPASTGAARRRRRRRRAGGARRRAVARRAGRPDDQRPGHRA